jgi:hypothetical protein
MDLNLSNKQYKFVKALRDSNYRYYLYGGGMGGGKSYLLAIAILSQAYNYPNTRYGVFRKNLTVLKRTTYQTFKKVAEQYGIPYSENRADMYWKLPNGSEIYFVEIDHTKDPDFNKVKGFELTAAGIDEANEILEAGFNILMARVGRENSNGEKAYIFCTCNPDQGWIKQRFYDPYTQERLEEPYYYMPALAKDNPWNSSEYLEALEHLPEAEYERYVMGNWDFSDDPNQLIRYEWVRDNLIEPTKGDADAMGVDVARSGNDRSTIAYRKDNTITNVEVISTQDTMVLTEAVIQRGNDRNVGYEHINVDVVGVGGGVVDALKAKGWYVHEYNSGGKPGEYDGALQYKNKRAQSYWEFREGLREGTIKIPNNQDLINELLSLRYFVKDKYIQIESKQELKKRLGKSPDLADACVMAFEKPDIGYIGFLEYDEDIDD